MTLFFFYKKILFVKLILTFVSVSSTAGDTYIFYLKLNDT